jgi:hypothetical protein
MLHLFLAILKQLFSIPQTYKHEAIVLLVATSANLLNATLMSLHYYGISANNEL